MRRSSSSTTSRDDAAARASCGLRASVSPRSSRSDHPLNPLRHELRLHGLCEEIVLDPFSEARSPTTWRNARHRSPRDEAFVRALHERTDGVPLFVASVMTEVIARAPRKAAMTRCRGAACEDGGSRESGGHHRSLHRQARQASSASVLSAAAVCGIEFRVNTISDALERDVVRRWVRRATSSRASSCGSIAPRADEGDDAAEPPYSFRHALFRQVLYERTAPAARAQLHRKVGAALERERAAGVPVAAAELAMHFERGREPMTALRYYAEAAEAALAALESAPSA